MCSHPLFLAKRKAHLMKQGICFSAGNWKSLHGPLAPWATWITSAIGLCLFFCLFDIIWRRENRETRSPWQKHSTERVSRRVVSVCGISDITQWVLKGKDRSFSFETVVYACLLRPRGLLHQQLVVCEMLPSKFTLMSLVSLALSILQALLYMFSCLTIQDYNSELS